MAFFSSVFHRYSRKCSLYLQKDPHVQSGPIRSWVGCRNEFRADICIAQYSTVLMDSTLFSLSGGVTGTVEPQRYHQP